MAHLDIRVGRRRLYDGLNVCDFSVQLRLAAVLDQGRSGSDRYHSEACELVFASFSQKR